jgi:hypothetical protein
MVELAAITSNRSGCWADERLGYAKHFTYALELRLGLTRNLACASATLEDQVDVPIIHDMDTQGLENSMSILERWDPLQKHTDGSSLHQTFLPVRP